MDPSYAREYRELAVRHWWWRARNAHVRRRVETLLGGRRDAHVLDIGCGDGVLFPFLSRFGTVEGIEPDPLVVTADGPWRQVIHQRFFDATFAPATRYDLILMLDVLEHLDAPEAALRHASTLLSPGGRILITVPAFMALWTHHDDVNRHVTRFTKSTLAPVAAAAGLAILSSEYLFQWLFAAKLVERLKESLRGPSPLPTIPAAAANEALYRVSVVEARTGGTWLPFGSSLLALLAPRRQ
ncbi:MAG: class I SAM-dependent methyltransferase [Vicinamibacteraceae bacterium]